MSSNRDSRARRCAIRFDLSELRMLYEPADLRSLIARALAQFDELKREFDGHLAEQAYGRAARALHCIKGTASFFGGADDAIATLHDAERALRLSDAALVRSVLPRLPSIFAALSEALAAELADCDGLGSSEPKR